MPVDQKIDYIEFPCNDFDAVQSFYERSFGWTFVDYGPDYRSFTDDKINGGFYRADLHTSVANGGPLIILYADDLETTRDKVAASGGEIILEIFAFPGGRRFHFADPNRNELAVWSDR
jgi:predicted enzyme related to lactoylglutathione lyase